MAGQLVVRVLQLLVGRKVELEAQVVVKTRVSPPLIVEKAS